jgi:hypothetical protein
VSDAAPETITIVGSALSAYVLDGVNSIVISNPAAVAEGFCAQSTLAGCVVPDAGTPPSYATVTVTF